MKKQLVLSVQTDDNGVPTFTSILGYLDTLEEAFQFCNWKNGATLKGMGFCTEEICALIANKHPPEFSCVWHMFANIPKLNFVL